MPSSKWSGAIIRGDDRDCIDDDIFDDEDDNCIYGDDTHSPSMPFSL